jgi:chemotaxis protein methyltransferase CheR
MDLDALSRAAGLRLESFRASHVNTRVTRALEREEISRPDDLALRLREDARLRRRFRRSIAVSVSGVNRDPHQFDLLEQTLLPPLLAGSGGLTVWSAGSSDGTELYSIALLLERLGALDRSTFLGSDLLEENVALAVASGFGKQLRFEQRDIVVEGAPGTFTLVVCRNVAIYLAATARNTLYDVVAGALRRGGILLLGRSEHLLRPERFGLAPAGPNAYRRMR